MIFLNITTLIYFIKTQLLIHPQLRTFSRRLILALSTVDGLSHTVICHCPFFHGVYLYLLWPPPHESRHLRSRNQAPRVNRQTGDARAEAGPDRRRIKLWHSHRDSFPFSHWLTNRLQARAPPPCLLLSTSGFPSLPLSVHLTCTGAVSPHSPRPTSSTSVAWVFSSCTIACVEPKGV